MDSVEPLLVDEKDGSRALSGFWLRHLRRQDYRAVWTAMRQFTEQRDGNTEDELWWVEHDPVFTLGRAADESHVLDCGSIPVVRTDRGGQVTYHGPGQVVVYVLYDLKRAQLGIRRFVWLLEQSVIDSLVQAGIEARRIEGAPGVYVEGRKLAALGVRVHRGCSYHGLALNVDMDLQPFSRINPCGMQDLEVTQLSALGVDWGWGEAAQRLSESLVGLLEHEAANTHAPTPEH